MEGIQTGLLLTANEAVKSSYVRAFLVAALRGFIRSEIEAKVYPETTEISRDGRDRGQSIMQSKHAVVVSWESQR